MANDLIEWASLLIRWLHVVAAVAWIGASFYFVWLDQNLVPPNDPRLKAKGVDGELWAVHGGGFYNPQKYMVAPPTLPQNLHWFYWESYMTWLSGLCLFTLMYLLNPRLYLIDTQVMPLTPFAAVSAALGFLVIGFALYDGVCRFFHNHQGIVGILTAGIIGLATYGATGLFSGRAAFLIVGAMMATMMSANVFFWIIPGQKKVVAAMRLGLPVDPKHGKIGKMRSVHNTYLTLPVLFCMLSNHASQLYSHPHRAALLMMILSASVLIRQFFILRHKGIMQLWYPAFAALLIFLVIFWQTSDFQSHKYPTDSKREEAALQKAAPETMTARSFEIIKERCYGCHANNPTLMGGGAPKGIAFETPADLEKYAELIFQQSVSLKAMPLGNVTQMTEDERATLALWYQGIKPKDPPLGAF